MTSKAELRDEIRVLQDQVSQLLGTNDTLEVWRRNWLHGYREKDQISLQTTHNAFSELLKHLGVEHMTAAVMRIKELVALEQGSPTRLELIQKVTAAESNIRIHQLAIRQLEFQRDSAQRIAHDGGFELGNVKSRCEELEELLGDVITAVNSDASKETMLALLVRIDAMIGPIVGDEV